MKNKIDVLPENLRQEQQTPSTAFTKKTTEVRTLGAPHQKQPLNGVNSASASAHHAKTNQAQLEDPGLLYEIDA